MEPKPPTIPNPEPEPKVLSFEEFCYRDPKNASSFQYPLPLYNNFFYYFFSSSHIYENYTSKEHYKRFAAEHPDIVASLCEKLKNLPIWNKAESLKPFDKDLYEAYKIMRGYGVSDEDLFS
jgi:hypothetical protein